jgi:hypothetical protein
MFGPKIKIDKALYDRLVKVAELAGYSSVDEFVTHMIEREVATLEQAEADDKVEERLRGLGYIE